MNSKDKEALIKEARKAEKKAFLKCLRIENKIEAYDRAIIGLNTDLELAEEERSKCIEEIKRLESIIPLNLNS